MRTLYSTESPIKKGSHQNDFQDETVMLRTDFRTEFVVQANMFVLRTRDLCIGFLSYSRIRIIARVGKRAFLRAGKETYKIPNIVLIATCKFVHQSFNYVLRICTDRMP